MARSKEFCEVAALEKALQLFWQKGYAATSMEELVKTMKISRSSLYAAYGDKEGLYLKALRMYRQKTSIPFIDAIREAQDPIAEMKRLFILNIQRSKGGDQKGCFMVRSMTEHVDFPENVNQITEINRNQVIQTFYQILSKAEKENIYKLRGSPAALANIFFTLHLGTQVLLADDADPQTLNDMVESAFDSLIERVEPAR